MCVCVCVCVYMCVCVGGGGEFPKLCLPHLPKSLEDPWGQHAVSGTLCSQQYTLADHLGNQKKIVETTSTYNCNGNKVLGARTAQTCTMSFPQWG